MTYLMLINLLLSIIMVYSSYPILMGMMLLSLTFFFCISIRMMSSSSWISSTLFLIMIGGLMIIFLYTTSICSNQKFKTLNIKMPMIYFILCSPVLMFSKNSLIKLEETTLMDTSLKEFFKLFMPMNFYSTFFILIYLIFTLTIMINLLNFNSGPMRKKY
uniref:NADH dehydrogenase subunit 6 n=1 Tax=Mycopsylla proxima TaxID=1681221 RepID=A0A343UQT5_9HEMI|nr:NADH dehydrogenase subunit 6 [Mycopsylla proxima]AVF97060.1 NADH dehydrogenase subunit 6 [Mycopsylla proxima]